MKKVLWGIAMCCCYAMSYAELQQKPENVVADFGYFLNQWCRTNDTKYREKIVDLCEGNGFRVSDQIAIEKAKYQGKYQDLNAYLKIFGDLRSNSTQIVFSNIKKVTINNCKTKEDSELQPIYADISIKSTKWNYRFSDLFYVKKGKIVYIGDYDGEVCLDCTCELPIEVMQIEFKFADVRGNESKYGEEYAYSGDCQWIYSRAKIKSPKTIKDLPILRRILFPSGENMHCPTCGVPKDFTSADTIDVEEGEHWYYFRGTGYSNSSFSVQGKYQYELWAAETPLIAKSFVVLPPKPAIVDYLEITNIEFVGIDKNDNEITRPIQNNGVLSPYNKIKGIKVKLYYTKLSKDININVVFDVEGKNLRDDYYTNSSTIQLQKNTKQCFFKIKYSKMPRNKYVRIEISSDNSNATNSRSKNIYNVKIE